MCYLIYERVALEENFVQKRLAETYELRGISGSIAIYSLLSFRHDANFGQVEEWIALKYGLFIVIELVVTARSFSQAGIESNAKIGLLVAVPNLLGVIAMPLICRHSDKMQERRWHLAACFTLIAMGYLVIVSQLHGVVGLLIGFSIAHIGILAGAPLSWTIPTRMLTPVAAAVGIGVIASIGNLGGFFAPVLIGKFSQLTGNLGIGFLVIGALQLIGALWTAFTVRISRH